jgi:AcrR family transcriptional regulator
MTAVDRRADRRRRLLEAALEIVGTSGYRRATIEEVCARAGVTARNFYDELGSREDMLLALYDAVVEEHLAAGAAAIDDLGDDLEAVVRRSTEATIRAWIADERKARVAFIEIIGVSERAEDRRFEVLRLYGAWVAATADRLVAAGVLAPRDRTLTGLAIVGAMTQLLSDWLHGAERRPVEELIDELALLATAMLRA